eukprot:4758782-Pyramimonas_sp.AAC.1
MVRGPIGSSTIHPSSRAHMVAGPHVSASLKRFVAPYGALPKAPAARSIWRRRPTVAYPSH